MSAGTREAAAARGVDLVQLDGVAEGSDDDSGKGETEQAGGGGKDGDASPMDEEVASALQSLDEPCEALELESGEEGERGEGEEGKKGRSLPFPVRTTISSFELFICM